MPYIKKGDGRREALQRGEPALNAGELNYQIFYYLKHNKSLFINEANGQENFEGMEQIRKYVRNFLGEKPNYQRYNDMTGCLIRCEKEINRRLEFQIVELRCIMSEFDDEIAKYEDKKIKENGDVE